MAANLKELAERYKGDRESVCNTWFIDNETRMKTLRSIAQFQRPAFRSLSSAAFRYLLF
ncbi:MAG TPA: hypothetical protein VIU40_01845 [Geobacteraceae bacterium]